jgi:hypothetical protein
MAMPAALIEPALIPLTISQLRVIVPLCCYCLAGPRSRFRDTQDASRGAARQTHTVTEMSSKGTLHDVQPGRERPETAAAVPNSIRLGYVRQSPDHARLVGCTQCNRWTVYELCSRVLLRRRKHPHPHMKVHKIALGAFTEAQCFSRYDGTIQMPQTMTGSSLYHLAGQDSACPQPAMAALLSTVCGRGGNTGLRDTHRLCRQLPTSRGRGIAFHGKAQWSTRQRQRKRSFPFNFWNWGKYDRFLESKL